jgi:hypothetical protein
MENGKANIPNTKIRAVIITCCIYLLNAFLVFLIIRRVIVINSDKAVFVFMAYYPIIFIFDMIMGRVLNRHIPVASNTFMVVSICLMILYFPIAFILSQY